MKVCASSRDNGIEVSRFEDSIGKFKGWLGY